MPRAKKAPSPRDYAVAQNLLRGDSNPTAARLAGYSPTYAASYGKQIAQSDGVRMALVELGASLPNEHLGHMAKARLYEDLLDPPKGDKGAKARLAITRTGLEVAGMIGGPSELHLHQHAMLPKAVQDMLLAKMEEIKAQKEAAIDATIVSEGAASEGQSEENTGGVQSRGLALGFRQGAAGQETQPGHSDSTQSSS